jgi:hypothetical protein
MRATTGTEGRDDERTGYIPPFVTAGVPSDGKGVSPLKKVLPFVTAGVPSDGKGVSPLKKVDRAGTPPERRDGTDDGIVEAPSVEDDDL